MTWVLVLFVSNGINYMYGFESRDLCEEAGKHITIGELPFSHKSYKCLSIQFKKKKKRKVNHERIRKIL